MSHTRQPMNYFAWVKGPAGTEQPQAQLWSEDLSRGVGNDKDKPEVLIFHQLRAEEQFMSIEELKKVFPYGGSEKL